MSHEHQNSVSLLHLVNKKKDNNVPSHHWLLVKGRGRGWAACTNNTRLFILFSDQIDLVGVRRHSTAFGGLSVMASHVCETDAEMSAPDPTASHSPAALSTNAPLPALKRALPPSWAPPSPETSTCHSSPSRACRSQYGGRHSGPQARCWGTSSAHLIIIISLSDSAPFYQVAW